MCDDAKAGFCTIVDVSASFEIGCQERKLTRIFRFDGQQQVATLDVSGVSHHQKKDRRRTCLRCWSPSTVMRPS